MHYKTRLHYVLLSLLLLKNIMMHHLVKLSVHTLQLERMLTRERYFDIDKYMYYKNCFFSFTEKFQLLLTILVKWSAQAIRMRAGVAGVSRGKRGDRPASMRAAVIAWRTAISTDMANRSGGSPTPCNTQGIIKTNLG